MDVSEAIRTKRATREFEDKPLSDGVITAIIDAGRRAQSARNRQPWHFIAIQDQAIKQSLVDISPNAGHLAGAALGVAIVTPPPETSSTIMFDAGQAASYMQLAGWEMGIGSCLGSIHDADQARAVLGFPEDMNMLIVISFGYPLAASNPQRAPKRGGRRSLEDVLHWDKW